MSATSASGMLALCGSFIGLSTLSVGLRLYGRKRQGVALGLDDWSALFGVVTFIGAAGIVVAQVHLGSNGWKPLTPVQLSAIARTNINMALAYDWLIMNTLACAKLSALFLYRRLFGIPPYGRFNIVILVTAAIVFAWCITFDALSLLQCRSHFSSFWNGNFKKDCTLNPVWARGLAVSDFLLDLWVFLLPVPMIWGLHMSLGKRLSVIGVFLLALVGIGASIARIVVFFEAKQTPGAAVIYIGVFEAGMIMTVVNLPSIWYICTSTFPQQLRRTFAGRTSMYSTKESQNSQNSSIDASKTSSVYAKGPAVSAQAVESSESQVAPPQDFRTDLESRTFETHTTGGRGRNHAERRSAAELPSNVIHMQNDIEVKRDQSRTK